MKLNYNINVRLDCQKLSHEKHQPLKMRPDGFVGLSLLAL